MSQLLNSHLLQTRKPGKGKGEPSGKIAKKAVARGSKAKGKNKPKKRSKQGAK